MSLRSCSDLELAFELAIRARLSVIGSAARSFDDFLDCAGNDGVHPAWVAIERDLFACLDECCADLGRIRKGVVESAPGEYSGRAYD